MDICRYKSLTSDEILSVVKTERICKLGTSSTSSIEIVPMWYIFDYYNGNFTFYFISINQGTKMDNIKDTGMVCVFIEKSFVDYCITTYKTIVANGNATIVNNSIEKDYIFSKFINKYYNNFIDYDYDNIDYIKVEISEITGRMY